MIHHVFANRSNAGDWLSAMGIQRLLQPAAFVEHRCDEDFVPETLAALAQVGQGDLVVIGGGGLFMDYFAPFWKGLLELRSRPRYCIWGVGYCDLKAEPSHPDPGIIEAVVQGSALCIVRDEMSRRHLSRIALPDPVPCPSIVEIDAAPPGHGILHVDNYTTVGAAAFDVMDAACRRHASETGRPYRRTNNRLASSGPAALAQCLSLYASSDLVVSSALHGCIIAVAMGRPVLAVSGDWKIEGFMHAAGLGDWVIDHRDLRDMDRMVRALGSQEVPRAFLAKARAANHVVARQVRALIEDGTALSREATA